MRRPNGMGTIVKLAGNRRTPYAVRIPTRDARGRVVQTALSYHATCAAAQAALDVHNAGTVSTRPVAPDKFSVTLGEVYELWSVRKYAKAGPASVTSYKASWGRLRVLEKVKMRNVTVDCLQALIDKDERAGLSKSSVTNDKILMKALFRFAMERDIAEKDYSAFVSLPHVEAKHEKGALTEEQLSAIGKMAQAGVPWADTVFALCYTGFRISEFLRLTPSCYHLDEQYVQGGIKTEAGRGRMVPVHPKIRGYFDRWLAQGGDNIVCNDKGKPCSASWYRAHAFAPIMEKLGLPLASPHWCRYTFASRLHAAGVAELEIKRLLGHADKDITEHYTKIDLAQLTTAINRMK